MTGPITVELTLLASGTAIVVSLGNIVWLHRLGKRHEQLMAMLHRIERLKGGHVPDR